MKELWHIRPEDIEGPEAQRHHRISLTEGGKEIGFAELFYYGKPVPFFRLLNLNVSPDYQKQGFGSRILDAVEQMLVEKGKMGVLEYGISDTSHAKGMYQRRGWQQIPGVEDWYVFNPRPGLDLATLSTLPKKLEHPKLRDMRARIARRLRGGT